MTIIESVLEKFRELFYKLLLWRERNIQEKNFILIVALIIGIVTGFVSLLLKFMIEEIAMLATSHLNVTGGNFQYIICPMIGILLAALYVKYIVRYNISHGVTKVLYAISKSNSRLKPHNMYSSVVASSITIGFGGSVGAEGPIVYTGAAIGSNIGRVFRLSPRLLMIMVGCGAAAGIAGIFKAPIAGMLFTIEVLMLDLTAISVMPLLVASISAATVAYAFTGFDVQFFFAQSEMFETARIPLVIALGIFCGLVSIYFTKAINMMENMFKKIEGTYNKFFIGAAILGLLIFIFPPLYGEGYGTINQLLAGDVTAILDGSIFYGYKDSVWMIAIFIGLIILTKVFATSATTGGGGVGGTFAPSLYVGCLTGFFFAYILNLLGMDDISTKNFALMGMAGVMSGVMHAPLMAIFLTAEMTGGYQLFLPLLIVSTISYGTIKLFIPYSIYSMRLAQRGELLTHHKDKTVLTLLKIDSVIETDFKEVSPEMNLQEMVDVIATSKRNLFPVLDKNRRLIGVVFLDEIRNIMFRPDLYKKMKVYKFMSMASTKIEVGDSMENVMKTFDRSGAWNLPVVENGKYIGFVSKSKIFNSYRQVLKQYTDD